MKTPRLFNIVLNLSAIVVLSAVSGNSAPATKVAPEAEPVIPQSVFSIPTNGGAAHDPFFPNRIIQAEAPKATTNAAPRTSNIGCLVLKGLSGTPSKPLAMINGYTMTRGEESEITTECGKLLVHCVDITTNSAIVEVGGERRELRLRSNF